MSQQSTNNQHEDNATLDLQALNDFGESAAVNYQKQEEQAGSSTDSDNLIKPAPYMIGYDFSDDHNSPTVPAAGSYILKKSDDKSRRTAKRNNNPCGAATSRHNNGKTMSYEQIIMARLQHQQTPG